MSSVKDAIEEMIEESYLLGLSEAEIRRDFLRFIDTCYQVIYAHIKDGKIIANLAEDLAREKTCILIADRSGRGEAEAGQGVGQDGSDKSLHDVFAEQVARRKRMILKTIGKHDPNLVRLIDEQRFQVKFKETKGATLKIPKRHTWSEHRLLVLKIGYAVTVVLIILLIYLGFTQQP